MPTKIVNSSGKNFYTVTNEVCLHKYIGVIGVLDKFT